MALASRRSERSSAIAGAAFLMATSAIGPGFLTQTTVFTQQLVASFSFVILVTILLDICIQLNIWRIITVSGLRAQQVTNNVLPGSGYLLSSLVVLGGLAFNIGNIAGCGLGLNVLSGIPVAYGAVISCIIALLIFWMKSMGKVMDSFARVLGIVMIGLTVYVAFTSHPPIGEALKRSVAPIDIDVKAIITLVGGTVGGYISFAGAHRLLDAGITGSSHLKEVNRSSISGILITATMRTVLFLAALGVVSKGFQLDADNPPASVFRFASGELGYKFFGIVMWCAAITSVVGAAYTSVSFLKTFHPFIAMHERMIISFFIIFSTLIFIIVGKPVQLLVAAGAINGLVLPIAFLLMLIASNSKSLLQNYVHPLWLKIVGWTALVIVSWLSVETIGEWLRD